MGREGEEGAAAPGLDPASPCATVAGSAGAEAGSGLPVRRQSLMERERESHAPPSPEIERRGRCPRPAYAGGEEGQEREEPLPGLPWGRGRKGYCEMSRLIRLKPKTELKKPKPNSAVFSFLENRSGAEV